MLRVFVHVHVDYSLMFVSDRLVLSAFENDMF